MADIRPFPALRYDLARAGNPADLLGSADALESAEGRTALRARSRYNVAQLVPDGPPASPDDAPATRLQRWVREGRLRREGEPSFYAVDQTWAGPAGRVVRRGFLGLLRLDDSPRNARLLHQPVPPSTSWVADLRAELVPVQALFDDPEGEVQEILQTARSAFPDLVVSDEQGIEHRLFPILSPWEIQRLARFMASRPVLVAAGQETWNAALQFRADRRAEGLGEGPWDWVLTYFSGADGAGIDVQAVHRVVSGLPAFELSAFQRTLESHFDVEPLGSLRDVAGIATQLEEAGRRGPAVAVLSGGAARRRAGLVAVLRPALGAPTPDPSALPSVDLALVNELAVKPSLALDLAADPLPPGVEAVHGLETALQRGRDKNVQLLLLFNPLGLNDVRRLADAGTRLPARCVRLFPPPLAGPAIYDLTP